MEPSIKNGVTVVIKVGTSSLVREAEKTISLSNLASICETVHALRSEGYNVVIVSSGAVGVGCQRLGLATRPKGLVQRQALAALGQVYLMRHYEDFFNALGLRCAQVLLTLDNLANRNQYLNARNTFSELFNYGVVTVVNENDTVAVEELRFGDNDTLSAQVATVVGASWLFLLTDVASLYTANPQLDPNATAIREVHDIMELKADVSSHGTQWGTGGMATKLTAARIATAAGCSTVICQASNPEAVLAILHGSRDSGTIFHAHPTANKGRKRWIPAVPVKGQLWMDAGAVRAVQDRSQSLLSAGIVRVTGQFSAQDAISLCNAEGTEFARGLCNYSSVEVDRIKGKSSRDFMAELGYLSSSEIVHRDNISLLALAERSRLLIASTSNRHHTATEAQDSAIPAETRTFPEETSVPARELVQANGPAASAVPAFPPTNGQSCVSGTTPGVDHPPAVPISASLPSLLPLIHAALSPQTTTPGQTASFCSGSTSAPTMTESGPAVTANAALENPTPPQSSAGPSSSRGIVADVLGGECEMDADVAERLATLRERDTGMSCGSTSASQGNTVSEGMDDDSNWNSIKKEWVMALAEERDQGEAMQGPKLLQTSDTSKEDLTEAGWLPR